MMEEGSITSVSRRYDPDVAELHTLSLNLASFRRPLDRREGDGALVQVDAALVEFAIGVGYDEVRSMKALLETIPNDPTVAWHPSVAALSGALEKLNIMLSALEAALSRRGG
jgi:hypothetical protein